MTSKWPFSAASPIAENEWSVSWEESSTNGVKIMTTFKCPLFAAIPNGVRLISSRVLGLASNGAKLGSERSCGTR